MSFSRSRRLVPWRGALCCLAPILAGCGGSQPAQLQYEIVAAVPHDPEAYTQGLLVDGRTLIESTGQYGASSLRRVDIASGRVLAQVPLDSAYFGEGVARVDSTLIQLTWKAGVAFVYHLASLTRIGERHYEGEGWGLCFDGDVLWMSNGSSALTRRDPRSFEALDTLVVRRAGEPVPQLNELECVGEYIYANVFQSDLILRIDKATGAVVGELDGAELSRAAPRPPDPEAVLNGIAYVPESGLFLMTGKRWPTLFVVRIAE